MRRWHRAVGAAALVVATSCAAGDSGPPGIPPSASEEAPAQVDAFPTTTAVTAVPSVPARFEFVDYVVVGGVAGLDDQLKVYPDGRAIYQSRSRRLDFTLPAATVAALRAALERSDIASIPPVDNTVAGSADLRAHRIIYGGRSVRFHDTTIPPSLVPALEILEREVARARAMP